MSVLPSHVSFAAQQWGSVCTAVGFAAHGSCTKKIKQDTTCWALFQRSCIISPSSLRVKDLCPQSSAHLPKARGGTQPSHAGQLGTSRTGNCSGWSWFWIHLWSQSQHNCNALKKNKKKILSFLSTWLLTASAQLDHIHWILGEYQSLISPH